MTPSTREKMLLAAQMKPQSCPATPIVPNLFAKPAKPSRPITDIPQDVLITIRVRMYALGALVWDYVDTVTTMATLMHKPETKKLNRAVRQVMEDYNYYRRLNADVQHRELEMQWALDFEGHVGDYTKQLIRGVKREMVDKFGEIEEETEWFMIAVHQAMCMLEALQIYVKGCDKAIARYGVDMEGKTLLPKQFSQLAQLLPEYGGDLIRQSPVRRAVAENIAKELTKIVVCDASGDLQQPEMNL